MKEIETKHGSFDHRQLKIIKYEIKVNDFFRFKVCL